MDHVFVIVMENHAYGEVVGSTSAPYFNSVISSGALGESYFAVAHPSLPNYLSLVGASTFGITSDCTTCWVTAPNIADRVETAGSTWKAYMESMPSPCFVGDSYPYVQKHDPLIYFNDIRTNATRCAQHIVPYSQMSTDLKSTTTTPNYAFITPNMCNDTHDCAVGTGDAWLKAQVPVILGSPAFKTQHSLLAIVWDEDDSSAFQPGAAPSARFGRRGRFQKPRVIWPLLAASHNRERARTAHTDCQRHDGSDGGHAGSSAVAIAIPIALAIPAHRGSDWRDLDLTLAVAGPSAGGPTARRRSDPISSQSASARSRADCQ